VMGEEQKLPMVAIIKSSVAAIMWTTMMKNIVLINYCLQVVSLLTNQSLLCAKYCIILWGSVLTFGIILVF